MKVLHGEVPYLIGMYPRGLTLCFRNIIFVTRYSFKPLASDWIV